MSPERTLVPLGCSGFACQEQADPKSAFFTSNKHLLIWEPPKAPFIQLTKRRASRPAIVK